MRYDICNIPIADIFETTDGCPLCRMHKILEERVIDYIMGDAMMESDVRIGTNRLGFCPDHYEKMLNHKGRLQLSLMLSTHLKEISDTVLSCSSPQEAAKSAARVNDSCFVCDKILWGEQRLISTIYRSYETDDDFRIMFNKQPHFCLFHYEILMSGISKKTCRKHGGEMAEKINEATKDYCNGLISNLSGYSNMYDYRNAGKKDFGSSRFSVEDSIDFLTMGEKGGKHKSTK